MSPMRYDKEFTFEVGLDERHHVTCAWAQMVGLFVVKVDGIEVLRSERPSVSRSFAATNCQWASQRFTRW